jgi:ABC-type Fe3+/spermidine/putrescine transport system ATPase subunit
MTVAQNIGYGLKIRRRKRKEIRAAVEQLLELVRLKEHREKYPAQLSGGQQQRVAIARTLAYQPEVLLFDEPFGALDAQTRTHLRSEIRALLRKVKVPAIFITHDQEEALELGDRIAVINGGRIEQIGTPQEIYDHSATEYVATFLGRANLLKGRVHQGKLQVGSTLLLLRDEAKRFGDGDLATLVFRPEDVRLAKNELLPGPGHYLGSGLVTGVNFAGAFERLVVQLNVSSQQFKVTAPLQQVLVTRLKPEAGAPRFKIGDQVQLELASFTVLPNESGAVARLSRRALPQADISADGDSALLDSWATAPSYCTSERSMCREPEIC